MKSTYLFEIIFALAFIISCILIVPYKKAKNTNVQGEIGNKLALIHKMSKSNKENDGFCIENTERPIIPYEKEPGSLYLTEHINSVIDKKLIS